MVHHSGKEMTSTNHVETSTTADEVEVTYWNHVKTVSLIVAVLSLYFCELLVLIGGGVFARDIAAVVGGDSLTSWPALLCTIFTVALVPPTAQAADYWGRKWFLVVPNIFGVVGSIIISRANNFGTVIAGFCVAGLSFAANSLFATVVSEVLPRKYRSWGQAAANLAVALGSIFALLVGGALTEDNPAGFRTYFYIVAAFYAVGTLACALLYNSVSRELEQALTTRQKLQALDWAGYFLVASGTATFCLGLSWAQNPYLWSDAHVLAPLLVGALLLVILLVYSWKYKKDGLLHHALFQDRNLVIALISVFIEGMAFMASAYFFPYTLSALHGGTMNSFMVATCYMVAFPTFGVFAILGAFYIYKTRTVRMPGIFTFVSFLAFFIAMSTITPDTPQGNFWGYILFYGAGLGVCLVTYVTAAQFSTPPELISITSGFVFTIRSLGGSIGLAIFNALFSSGLNSNLVPKIAAAVAPLNLNPQQLGTLIEGLSAGKMSLVESIPEMTPAYTEKAAYAMKQAYVIGLRDVFVCGAAFCAVAIVAAAFLRNPKTEFTPKIDAPIEIDPHHNAEEKLAEHKESV